MSASRCGSEYSAACGNVQKYPMERPMARFRSYDVDGPRIPTMPSTTYEVAESRAIPESCHADDSVCMVHFRWCSHTEPDQRTAEVDIDLATALAWTAERHPERRAVGGSRPMTYRAWADRVDGLARSLRAAGVRPGDRVAYLLAGGEPLASLHLAAQRLGATSVPLSNAAVAEGPRLLRCRCRAGLARHGRDDGTRG